MTERIIYLSPKYMKRLVKEVNGERNAAKLLGVSVTTVRRWLIIGRPVRVKTK